jgi:hypothetical protein
MWLLRTLIMVTWYAHWTPQHDFTSSVTLSGCITNTAINYIKQNREHALLFGLNAITTRSFSSHEASGVRPVSWCFVQSFPNLCFSQSYLNTCAALHRFLSNGSPLQQYSHCTAGIWIRCMATEVSTWDKLEGRRLFCLKSSCWRRPFYKPVYKDAVLFCTSHETFVHRG